MSQRLIESDLGGSLGKGRGQKSQELRERQVSREMEGNLHLDTSCCSWAWRLNQQTPLLSQCSSRASGRWGEVCEKSEKGLLALSSCFLVDRFWWFMESIPGGLCLDYPLLSVVSHVEISPVWISDVIFFPPPLLETFMNPAVAPSYQCGLMGI